VGLVSVPSVITRYPNVRYLPDSEEGEAHPRAVRRMDWVCRDVKLTFRGRWFEPVDTDLTLCLRHREAVRAFLYTLGQFDSMGPKGFMCGIKFT
jgi:hypothetical protein